MNTTIITLLTLEVLALSASMLDAFDRNVEYKAVKKFRPIDSAWELALWRQILAF